jgi:hypothetical protein
LTHADLENGNFIDVELDKIKSGLDSVEDYWRYLGRWKKHFLDQNSCSKCEGWRICLGKFAEVAEEGSCRKFFTALLNNLDTMLDKKGGLKQNANVNP